MGKSILPYCGYQYKIKKLTTHLLSLLPSIISADLSENRRLLQRVEEVVFSDLWYNGVLIHVGFCCAWRLVVCDHNYNWRQRKTQLGIQLFNFRVRVLLKCAMIRKLIIKLLLLNYHVRPPIKIPQLNTTFPIKVLLSKPVVNDSFRVCKWPWIILRWPVQHFPSFNSVYQFYQKWRGYHNSVCQLPRSWHSPFPKQPMKRQYHHRGTKSPAHFKH